MGERDMTVEGKSGEIQVKERFNPPLLALHWMEGHEPRNGGSF